MLYIMGGRESARYDHGRRSIGGQGGRVPPKKNFGGDKGINVPPNNQESVVATGKDLEKL